MALTVGELVAYIRADDTQYNQVVDSAGQKFQGLERITTAGAKTVATAFTAATGTVAGLGVAAFKIGKDFNVLQQNSRSALKTILGSAEAAADQMDRLDEFASNSPFARQVWITAQQQLLGFGVEAQRVVPILDAVQQSVAAVGGNNEQIEAITFALAQMQGQGKLTGETLNQLGQYGIDAAGILGEELGKTGAEIRELASKPGGIPVDQVWDPLVSGLMESFGGATEGLRQQWDGAVDRMKAAWRDIGSDLAEPFIDPMGGGRAVDWANAFADTLRRARDKIGPFVDLLVDRLAPGMDRIVPGFEAAQDVINSWDVSQVNRQLDELGQYTPVIAGLATAMLALGGNSLGLSRLGFALNPVVAGLAAVAATSPEVRAMLGDFGRSLEPLLPILGDFGVILADVAMLALRELAPAIGEVLVAGGDLAVAVGSSLIPVLGNLLMAATPLIDVLADLLGWVADLPPEVQLAALAFLALREPLGGLASLLGTVGDGLATFVDMARVQASLGGVSTTMGALATTSAQASAGIKGIASAMAGILFNPVTLGIGAVAAALTVFVTKSQEAESRAKSYAEAVKLMGDESVQAVEDIARNSFVTGENADWGWWQKLQTGFDSVADAIEGVGSSVEDAARAVAGSDEEFQAYLASLEEIGATEPTLRTALAEIETKLHQQRNATEQARHENDQLGLSNLDAADAADAHRMAQEELRRELEDGIDATLSAAEATLRMEDAAARAADALNRKREAEEELERVMANANATEEEREAAQRASEQATRDADRAILDYVRSVDNQIAAIGRNNASYEQMRAEMAKARESFIEQRIQMGDTRAEASRLADQYGLIPSRVDTMVNLQGVQDALNQIGNLDRTLNNINGKQVTASVAIRQYGQAAIASGGYVGDFATALGYAGGGTPRRFPFGGHVTGPGSGTSDEIPAWLSNTEFVQRSAAVKKYGLSFMHAVNSLSFPTELARPFAVGGSPSSPAVTTTAARAGAAQVVQQHVHLHGIPANQPEEFAKTMLNAFEVSNRVEGYAGGYSGGPR